MGEAALQLDSDNENWPEDPRLQKAVATLSRIPAGREIVQMLRDKNICLTCNDAYAGSATTFVTVSKIEKGTFKYSHLGIHFGALPEGNMIQALVHEATHIRQHLEQRGYPPYLATDAQYKAHARALEAEAQAAATDIAWQLKNAGITDDAWAAVKQVGYADVAAAYEQAAANGGQAREAARSAWYKNTARLSGYDADITNHLIPYYRNLLSANAKHGLRRRRPLDQRPRAGLKP